MPLEESSERWEDVSVGDGDELYMLRAIPQDQLT